jgi:hypothetical protein
VTIPQLRHVDGPEYPGDGQRVLIRDVIVSAVDEFDEDGSGRTGNVWITEPVVGAWSGVQLYVPVVIPARTNLAPGDIVLVRGTLDEFVLLDDEGVPYPGFDGSVTELGDAAVQKTGETSAPQPIDVPVADLATAEAIEPYEGVLVRIRDVRVTGSYLTIEGTELELGSDLYAIPDLVDGSAFASLTGIVTYFFNYSLLPRGPADVEREP